MSEKILVTGPFGQVGTELLPQLQKLYGRDNVVALGHHKVPKDFQGVLEKADITDAAALRQLFKKHNFTQLYHLAALLSVTGEQQPHLAWDINLTAFKAILDLSVQFKLSKIFWASSIAVFGPNTPKLHTPQHTVIEPTTMYGLTKYAAQLLAQYYHLKFGLDVRSLRYPGIISWKELPGGGTTDYAIAIFHGALQHATYQCFVHAKTTIPMIFMDDAVRGTIELMQADPSKVKIRTSYNMAAISFTVEELAAAINKRVPLEVSYKADHRQKIADSWPDVIDDSEARQDWGWQHKIGLEELVDIMITNLKPTLKKEGQ